MNYIKVLLLLLFTSISFAQGDSIAPSNTLAEGNKAFQAADYTTAIELYKTLTPSYESVQLYHNLALSYFYNKELANSILNMERASRLAPMNSKVRKNLKLLYENVDSDIQNLPPFFIRSWLNTVSRIASSGVWLILHLLLVFLAAWLLYLYIIKSFEFGLHFYYVRGLIIGLLVLSLFFGLLSYNALKLKNDSRIAIVLKDNVVLRAGAEDNGQEISSLSEGLKVTIKDRINGFYLVRLGDFSEGWVDMKEIEQIVMPIYATFETRR